MRIDEMISGDQLRAIAAEFHERYGVYLVLDEHLTLTHPRRVAQGLRDVAEHLKLGDIADAIDPAQIDAAAIPAATAREMRQIEALSKALR